MNALCACPCNVYTGKAICVALNKQSSKGNELVSCSYSDEEKDTKGRRNSIKGSGKQKADDRLKTLPPEVNYNTGSVARMCMSFMVIFQTFSSGI